MRIADRVGGARIDIGLEPAALAVDPRTRGERSRGQRGEHQRGGEKALTCWDNWALRRLRGRPN